MDYIFGAVSLLVGAFSMICCYLINSNDVVPFRWRVFSFVCRVFSFIGLGGVAYSLISGNFLFLFEPYASLLSLLLSAVTFFIALLIESKNRAEHYSVFRRSLKYSLQSISIGLFQWFLGFGLLQFCENPYVFLNNCCTDLIFFIMLIVFSSFILYGMYYCLKGIVLFIEYSKLPDLKQNGKDMKALRKSPKR